MEYNLATIAYSAAKAAEGARYAPGLWYECERAYVEGKSHFEDREYELAREKFAEAQALAEKAENAARLIRFKEGEVF